MSVGPRALRAAALIGAISSVSAAQSASPIARYVPPAPNPAHVFVLDSAHILSAATIAALQDSALALQAETKADVAWVTLPTLGGRTIEEAALYIGRTWRIGTPGKPGDPLRNRGLVVLYVPDKAKTAGSNFRIEVGNGLEGTITDSRSRTITAAMREDLRARRYDSAYAAGWTAAAALVRRDFASHGVARVAAPTPPPVQHSGTPLLGVVVVILVLSLMLIVLVVIAARRKRRSPTMVFNRGGDDDDDERRRRSIWTSAAFGSAASGSDSSSDSGGNSSSGGSSSGGDFGGGGGFSGGGSSDSI
jgi:uncharacterized protein